MSKYSKTVYFCAALILCILKAAILNLIIFVLSSSSGCLAMPVWRVLALPHRAQRLPSNWCDGVPGPGSGMQPYPKHPCSHSKAGGSISSCYSCDENLKKKKKLEKRSCRGAHKSAESLTNCL